MSKSRNCIPGNDYTSYWSSAAGAPMIGPDGSVNLEVSVANRLDDDSHCGYPVSSYDTNIQLLQLSPGGGPSFQTVYDYNGFGVGLYPGEVIPDGQGGLLAAWTYGTLQGSQAHLTHVTPTSNADAVLPLGAWGNNYSNSWYVAPDSTLVLGENGVAFGAYNGNFVSFNIANGSANWAWTATYAGNSKMIAATSGNGLTVRDGNQVARLANTGDVTYDTWTGNQIDYWAGDLWTGDPADAGGIAYSATAVEFSDSDWFQPGNEGSRKSKQTVSVQYYSTSGAKQSLISSNLTLLANAVGNFPLCSSWLQGGGVLLGTSASTYINTILLSSPPAPLTAYYGHGTFDSSIAAFSAEAGTYLGSANNVPTGTLMVVNDNAGFFTADCGYNCTKVEGPQMYPGDTPTAQISILTHEVAHQIGVIGFAPDFGNYKAQKANQKLVDTNCGAFIETVGMVSPYSLTFSAQTVRTPSSAQSVTLSNYLNPFVPGLFNNTPNNMTFPSNPSITGPNSADFSVTTTCGIPLAPGNQCTVSVTFTPQGMGTRTATLNIFDSAGHSPQTVALTGTGD